MIKADIRACDKYVRCLDCKWESKMPLAQPLIRVVRLGASEQMRKDMSAQMKAENLRKAEEAKSKADKVKIQHLEATIKQMNVEKAKEVPVESEGDKCVVCMEQKANHLILECAHLALCSECATEQIWKNCPICRGDVVRIIKTYKG